MKRFRKLASIVVFSFILFTCSTASRIMHGGKSMETEAPSSGTLSPASSESPKPAAEFMPGVEVLIDRKLDVVKGKRVGLITNQSGVGRDMTSTLDILRMHPEMTIGALFAPEHGIRGDIPAGQPVGSYTDAASGLRVYSLYGQARKPTREMLAGIDAIVFDIQDVGVRPYTFIYTMANAMQAAQEAGIPFVVLDRPNPINGELVDGCILKNEFKSFIGMFPIAYVHGMTIGELAWMFNREFGIGCDLKVIPMTGWRRSMNFAETGMRWIPTSPHIPTEDTPVYYAITGCIGELGTLSVGVGYTMPFKIVGASWIDAEKLAAALNARHLPGVAFNPLHWQQFYGVFSGMQVGGIQIHVTNELVCKPFAVSLHILDAIHRLYPDKELYPKERIASFTNAIGDDAIVKMLMAGTPADSIEASYQKGLDAFKQLRKEYLLY